MNARPYLLSLGFALACALPRETAHAHGEPPSAYALLAADAEGVLSVRLSTGIAQRRGPQRFQFVCPAAWGDEFAAPAAALPDGTLVLGAFNGLTLLGLNGEITKHPSENARGNVADVIRAEDGVFALRNTQAGGSILHVTREEASVVWSDSRSWYSLALQHDRLAVVRLGGSSVEQVALSLQGTELDRRLGLLSWPVDYVFVRPGQSALYLLLIAQGRSELGVLEKDSFRPVVSGAASIAGPVDHAGNTIVGLNGALQQLGGDGGLTELDDPTYVRCLDHTGQLPYACTLDGLAAVSADGVGDPLFNLSWLMPPDLSALKDEKARNRCDYQWQDFKFDLVALNITVTEPEPIGVDAGVDEADSGTVADAADDAAPLAVRQARTSGCSAAAPSRFFATPWLFLGLCAAAVVRRRRAAC